jgi:hypothetical protein
MELANSTRFIKTKLKTLSLKVCFLENGVSVKEENLWKWRIPIWCYPIISIFWTYLAKMEIKFNQKLHAQLLNLILVFNELLIVKMRLIQGLSFYFIWEVHIWSYSLSWNHFRIEEPIEEFCNFFTKAYFERFLTKAIHNDPEDLKYFFLSNLKYMKETSK